MPVVAGRGFERFFGDSKRGFPAGEAPESYPKKSSEGISAEPEINAGWGICMTGTR